MSLKIIIQARTGSTRLPNKMLMPFYGDKGILEILLNKLMSSLPQYMNDIVVATTESKGDDKIELLCNTLNVNCYRGSEEDVLSRFVDAAKFYNADKIIRICADNVFLDMAQLEYLIHNFSNSDVDYMSFITKDGTPSIKTHYGFWTEAVKLEALEKVQSMTSEKLFHEHVTNYIYANPENFSLAFTPVSNTDKRIDDRSIRLTIDTETDFNISRQIYKHLSENNIPITTSNIIDYLEDHKEIYLTMVEIINANKK